MTKHDKCLIYLRPILTQIPEGGTFEKGNIMNILMNYEGSENYKRKPSGYKFGTMREILGNLKRNAKCRKVIEVVGPNVFRVKENAREIFNNEIKPSTWLDI